MRRDLSCIVSACDKRATTTKATTTINMFVDATKIFDYKKKMYKRKSEHRSPSKLISKMLSDSQESNHMCIVKHPEIIIELLIFDVIDNKRCFATFE